MLDLLQGTSALRSACACTGMLLSKGIGAVNARQAALQLLMCMTAKSGSR